MPRLHDEDARPVALLRPYGSVEVAPHPAGCERDIEIPEVGGPDLTDDEID